MLGGKRQGCPRLVQISFAPDSPFSQILTPESEILQKVPVLTPALPSPTSRERSGRCMNERAPSTVALLNGIFKGCPSYLQGRKVPARRQPCPKRHRLPLSRRSTALPAQVLYFGDLLCLKTSRNKHSWQPDHSSYCSTPRFFSSSHCCVRTVRECTVGIAYTQNLVQF